MISFKISLVLIFYVQCFNCFLVLLLQTLLDLIPLNYFINNGPKLGTNPEVLERLVLFQ